MHILPVLAGLEVLAPGGRPGIFFFVHLNCASNMQLLSANQKSTTEELQSTPPPSRAQRADLPRQLAPRSEFMLNL